VLLLALSALPFLLKAPETVRRITHPLEHEETIRAAAAEYNVEPTLVAAVIRTESRFDPEVESPQGAYNSGEGQVDNWISDEGFDVAHDIPFEETRNYVEDVLEARDTYAELYGKNLDRRPDAGY
jgi:soluble lytic murein transglycosylase